MQSLIKQEIGLLLKSISYEGSLAGDEKKIDYTDEFEIIERTSDMVEFEISRNVTAALEVAYDLKVVVRLQVFALEGKDLVKEFTDSFIDDHKKELAGTAMNYISALITQITGSFNSVPIITVPTFKVEK